MRLVFGFQKIHQFSRKSLRVKIAYSSFVLRICMDIFFSLDLLDKLHSNALEIVIQKALQFISAH